MKKAFENTNLNDPEGIIALSDSLYGTNGSNKSYDPTKDENYMGREMLAYFWKKMNDERNDVSKLVEKKRSETLAPIGAAESLELTVNHNESNLANRELKHLTKLNNVLNTFQNSIALHGVGGPYGFCNKSGEEIGVERLNANPTATLTIEEQTKMEKHLKHHMI